MGVAFSLLIIIRVTGRRACIIVIICLRKKEKTIRKKKKTEIEREWEIKKKQHSFNNPMITT